MSILNGAWHTFTSADHILAEMGWEAITFLIGYAILKPIYRRWKARFRTSIHHEIDAEHGVVHNSNYRDNPAFEDSINCRPIPSPPPFNPDYNLIVPIEGGRQ